MSTVSSPHLEFLHVQVAPAGNPLFRLLHRQGTPQPQARLAVGEDPHHPSAPLYLLVETLQAVCGTDTAPVPAVCQLGSKTQGYLPAWRREHPTQAFGELLTPVMAHHTEEVPRIVNLAALPGGPLEVAGYGRLEALVIVGDGELDAFEPTGLQRAEKLLVGRFALGVCNFHADDLPEAIVP